MKKAEKHSIYNIALWKSNQKAQMISDLETLKGFEKAIKNEIKNVKDNAVRLGKGHYIVCLLYTSDAADDLLCVDLGGRRII